MASPTITQAVEAAISNRRFEGPNLVVIGGTHPYENFLRLTVTAQPIPLSGNLYKAVATTKEGVTVEEHHWNQADAAELALLGYYKAVRHGI